ncbi:MAG: GNAT family N-acetyltransferase [Pseudomonadota bacterium]
MTKTEKTTIAPARGPDEVAEVRRLFVEYAESLNFDLCFQGFDQEIDSLAAIYVPPRGEMLLARVGNLVAGGVAVRSLEVDVCEMKRLYVRPRFRGLKLGRQLAEAIVAVARGAGYTAMRLDTIETMTQARTLYESMGFVPIPPYYHNPVPGVVYYELDLTADDRRRVAG